MGDQSGALEVRLPDGIRVRTRVRNRSLTEGTRGFLEFVRRYVEQTDSQLKAGEKINYGYWIVKLVDAGEGVLEVRESSPDGSDWIEGVEQSVRYWTMQHDACTRSGGTFDPPRPDQYAAISAGVLNREAVQGVRYPAPEHMSGWYLTTPSFDGGASGLRVEHLYHVTAARPDVAGYIALPPGYRFDTGTNEAWFDPEAAANG